MQRKQTCSPAHQALKYVGLPLLVLTFACEINLLHPQASETEWSAFLLACLLGESLACLQSP